MAVLATVATVVGTSLTLFLWIFFLGKILTVSPSYAEKKIFPCLELGKILVLAQIDADRGDS